MREDALARFVVPEDHLAVRGAEVGRGIKEGECRGSHRGMLWMVFFEPPDLRKPPVQTYYNLPPEMYPPNPPPRRPVNRPALALAPSAVPGAALGDGNLHFGGQQQQQQQGGYPAQGNAPQPNIHVVVVDRKDGGSENTDNRNAEKPPQAPHRRGDCFNRCISWIWFLFRFFLLLGLGIATIVLTNLDSCPGQPGLLTFLFGVGITFVWLAILVLLHFWYFQFHNNEQAGSLFRGLTVMTQVCVLALSIYGLVEVGLETINRGIQEGLTTNGLSGESVDSYACDTQVYEVAIVAVVIGLLYTANLVWRTCNYYKTFNQQMPTVPTV